MTGVDVVAATEDGPCATCGKTMLRGSRIVTDGRRAWHTSCAVPPPAGERAGGMAGQLAEHRTADSDHFVFIGAYVPIDRIELVGKAIREARGW